MATNHKRLGIREIIRIYKKLLNEEKISQNGSAFKRMLTLQTILKNRTKWVRFKKNNYLKKIINKSVGS